MAPKSMKNANNNNDNAEGSSANPESRVAGKVSLSASTDLGTPTMAKYRIGHSSYSNDECLNGPLTEQ